MNRLDFLKRLLALIGITLLSAKPPPAKDKTWLLRFFVRGFQYYHGPSLVSTMKKGELLRLVREPENEYDADAIAVYYKHHKIGFVPREDNEVISRLMDGGVLLLKAEVIKTDANSTPWEAVFAGIYVDESLAAA